MLHFACDDFSPAEIDPALESLQSSMLLTYRHYRRAFRPYEGSDVDIEARVREARAASSADPVPVAARLSLSTLPLVARRHSYLTGTLRAFDVRPCRLVDLQNAETFAVPPGVDGLVLLCLTDGASAGDASFRALEAAVGLSARPEVLVAAQSKCR